jgi:hypothetical protein
MKNLISCEKGKKIGFFCVRSVMNVLWYANEAWPRPVGGTKAGGKEFRKLLL